MTFRNAFDELATETNLKALVESLSERLRFYERIPVETKPLHIPEYRSEKGAAVAVALLSDVHCEERVTPEDVPGTYNLYDPEVCKKRIAQYAQRVILLTQAQRHLTNIDTLVLGILGDIMNGYLHDDNKESNWLAPVEAVLLALELLVGVINYLLEYGEFKKIVLVCTPGNHGRLTMKPRANTAIETNLEWMLYQLLQQRMGNDHRLEWHIASGAHVYLNINGKICRFHHGDDIKFQGGIGGLSIPLLKAISQWNHVMKADYDFVGHWHQCRDYGYGVVNGSVVGFNAFALKSKCPFEHPKQAYILIDSKRGKSLFADIWTDFTPGLADLAPQRGKFSCKVEPIEPPKEAA
jgi:hypothetical protein